jgi:hypothetical protein
MPQIPAIQNTILANFIGAPESIVCQFLVN